jgi:subtilisin family serine protease
MVRRPTRAAGADQALSTASPIDEMLLAALERDETDLKTGRYIVTYKEGAMEQGAEHLQSLGLVAADAREFSGQAVSLEAVAGADALLLPELGIAVVAGPVFEERGFGVESAIASDSPIEAIEPETFVFPAGVSQDYLRGFRRATETIAADLADAADTAAAELDFSAESIGATWGLAACRVPQSARSGAGIRVAVLDTGMDLGHPEFAGRSFTTETFVGQPVQDLHGHGTHCIGTSCGPKAPAGPIQRYGIAFGASIFVGKVLSNSGSSVDGSVLAGMNWAIANLCTVISMSLGARTAPQAAYTAAGRNALNRGLLIIAAAGNDASGTGAPANSPTIMSVASLDPNLRPSSFSNFGKIEIAGPGRDVFSSLPRPRLHGIKSGTSMATPHVAGCAALWAQADSALRGQALWNKLLATAKPLAFPASKVGKGLVQAPG